MAHRHYLSVVAAALLVACSDGGDKGSDSEGSAGELLWPVDGWEVTAPRATNMMVAA